MEHPMRNTQGSLTRLRTIWEREVGEMDDIDWQEALTEGSIKASYRLVQLKILYKTYYTRTLLHKIGKIRVSECLRGCGMEGTLIHTLWHCPKIHNFG